MKQSQIRESFKVMNRLLAAALALACAASISTPAFAQGACNRDLLQGIADDWVSAVEKGTPFELNLGEWVDFQQNLEIGFMGIFFDRPRPVEWHQPLLDTTSCKTFVASVVLEDAEPLVLATVLNNGFFGVSPINNLTTAEGDWQFDARATSAHVMNKDWSPIPEGQRASRDELIAAADAYLDRFGDASIDVPWAAECVRLDGAALREACDAGLPQGIAATERQYTVDDVLGGVNVLAWLGEGEERLASSHTLRVEDGLIRHVHTIVSCGDRPGCGLAAGG
jgi:hypothetical protein